LINLKKKITVTIWLSFAMSAIGIISKYTFFFEEIRKHTAVLDIMFMPNWVYLKCFTFI